MTLAQSTASSGSAAEKPMAQTSPGPFILTLCRLASLASVRPPRAPQLKQFKFFTSRARHPDGSERLYLHMGYFSTLNEAQKWAQLMRGAYPNTIATLVPPALLRQQDNGIPTLTAAEEDKSLTDTQVLNILEARRIEPVRGTGEVNTAHIPLVRPDDSGVRRALKEAVVQGAPVSFAVQLLWSVQPIELASLPALPIFKAFTLYTTEGHREGRSWHCLRLGFFRDAISAKQVASYVRSSFSSVAVVPISEQERSSADNTRVRHPTVQVQSRAPGHS